MKRPKIIRDKFESGSIKDLIELEELYSYIGEIGESNERQGFRRGALFIMSMVGGYVITKKVMNKREQ